MVRNSVNKPAAARRKRATWDRKRWFWLLVNLAAALPLLLLLWDAWRGNLSVNPIDDFTDRTGKAAIIILLLSLACTPVASILGWRLAATVRKSLGLWAFAYAGLHFLVFIGLDYGFNIGFILQDDLLQKRYIFVGLLALLAMLPLAITSTKGWMRRLGKGWKKLHRLAYAAGVLAVLHFLWLAKGGRMEPFLYAAALALLLIVRIPAVRKRAITLRRRLAT
ncbi:MAG: sulfoxide reductase heme-binding subunit YedZ [Caldilineaceae bacterium]|nr:sulfoxide reductase heme-binding subunit YedZ [Caldilineaceae bacterium]